MNNKSRLHTKQRQSDFVKAVINKMKQGQVKSQAIKQTALDFGISERWGYKLIERQASNGKHNTP